MLASGCNIRPLTASYIQPIPTHLCRCYPQNPPQSKSSRLPGGSSKRQSELCVRGSAANVTGINSTCALRVPRRSGCGTRTATEKPGSRLLHARVPLAQSKLPASEWPPRSASFSPPAIAADASQFPHLSSRPQPRLLPLPFLRLNGETRTLTFFWRRLNFAE